MNQVLLISRRPKGVIADTISDLLVGTYSRNNEVYKKRTLTFDFKGCISFFFITMLLLVVSRIVGLHPFSLLVMFTLSIIVALVVGFISNLRRDSLIQGITLSIGRKDETVILIDRWDKKGRRIFNDDIIYHIVEALREVDILLKVIE